jgi:hypothetical protein
MASGKRIKSSGETIKNRLSMVRGLFTKPSPGKRKVAYLSTVENLSIFSLTLSGLKCFIEGSDSVY